MKESLLAMWCLIGMAALAALTALAALLFRPSRVRLPRPRPARQPGRDRLRQRVELADDDPRLGLSSEDREAKVHPRLRRGVILGSATVAMK